MILVNQGQYLKKLLKFWVPTGLLELYRRNRYSGDAENTIDVIDNNIQFLLPQRRLDELFPGIESSKISINVSQIYKQHDWALPLAERLYLAAICNQVQPKIIFEIGTYTGSSTLVMAMNTPPETEIFTLDLDPFTRDTHKHGLGIGGFPEFTVGASYRGTPFEKKIHQLFGNSLTFDYSSFLGSVDLILIDADHTYDFVKLDTEKAFKLLRPGGIIIWDDYLWDERYPECGGVTHCLNELLASKPCFQIAGTRFAIYLDDVKASY